MNSRSNRRRTLQTRSLVQQELFAYEKLEPRKMLAGDLASTVAIASSGPSSLVYTLENPVPVQQRMDLLRDHLGLGANEQLKQIDINRDAYGFAHVKYQQYFNGYEVLGGIYSAHVKDRQIVSLSGDYKNVVSLDSTAVISESMAIQNALDHVNASSYIWDDPDFLGLSDVHDHGQFNDLTGMPEGELVVLQSGLGEYELTYKFDVFAIEPFSRTDIFVDASSGEIVASHDQIHAMDVPASGISLYNDEVEFTAFEAGNEFILLNNDPGVFTLDLNGSTDIGDGVPFSSPTPQFDDPEVRTGVQAHWGAEQTHKLLEETYSYDSYDGDGSVMLSYTSYGNNVFNAFWMGTYAVFGDGDGVENGPLVSLDIVGHEFFHGVTQYSSGLIYADESGALNESFSDIFGKVVENFATGTNNWRIGHDIGLFNSGAIRNMEDPNEFEDPDTYMGDFWDPGGAVHTNSGVQNKWFQLMTDGGTGTNDNGDDYDVVGIGIDDAGAIAFRNLTVYLTPDSEYVDARLGALQAATDLFGRRSQQYMTTAAAWDAVGVYDPRFFVDLPDFTAVKSDGSLIYQTQVSGVIEDESHFFSIEMDGSQSLALRVQSDFNLNPLVRLLDSNGSELLNMNAGVGSVLEQGLQVPSAGTYELEIGGEDTMGEYILDLWLNTNLELEGLVPDSFNGTIQSAQNIESSSTPFSEFTDRLGVIGSVAGPEDTTPVVSEGFETGTFDEAWTISSSDPNGRIQLTDKWGTADGSFAMIMDQTLEGNYNLNEAIWTVDVANLVDPSLSFFHADFNDEPDPLPAMFSGSFDGDGVSISEDGQTWYTILTDTDYPVGTWFNETFLLTDLAAETGLALDGVIQVKFQQYDDFSVDTDGRGYDQISIRIPDSGADWYSFQVADQTFATVAATALNVGTIRVDVFDAAGNPIMNGTDGTNVSSYANQFVGTGDVVYARVMGVTEYSLVVTRNADFDLGPFGTRAQDISNVAGVLGHVSSLDTLIAEPDEAQLGEILNDFYPGVTLSNDVTGGDVFAADGSSFGAPTGTMVFSSSAITASGWRDGVNVLRADFEDLQTFVSIDVGADDTTDTGYLRAYAADGTFLEEVVSSALAEGESETLTIMRPIAEIAYILAAGVGGDITPFDNLVFQLSRFDEDVYSIEVEMGDEIGLTGILPGGGPFSFENDLSVEKGSALLMDLIDPQGTVIETNVSEINVIAELDGIYQVRVYADAGTSGEYFLQRDIEPALADVPGIDFGPDNSIVFQDYAGVSNQGYNPNVGYGWTQVDDLSFASVEGNRGNDLTRDRVILRDGTFVINVANGTYNVDVLFGAMRNNSDSVTITAEGQVDTFKMLAGPNAIRSYVVDVTDGQMTLEFSGAPGLDSFIRIAGIEFSAQAAGRLYEDNGTNDFIVSGNRTILGSRLQLVQPIQPITSISNISRSQLPSFKVTGLSGSHELTRIDLDGLGKDLTVEHGIEAIPSIDALNELVDHEFAVI